MDTTIHDTTTVELILSGISLQQFFVYVILAIFGLLLSLAIELYKHWKVIRSNGGFSPTYWLQSNAARIIVTMLVVIAGILFSKDLIGLELNNFTAFLAGFTSDKVIDSLIKRKS